MISISDAGYLLTNGRISYAFRSSEPGILEHLHFGEAVSSIDALSAMPKHVHRVLSPEYEGRANYHLGYTPQEFPVFGLSDFRRPALHGVNEQGVPLVNLVFEQHEVLIDKPELDGLPSARGGNSETLLVTLIDSVVGLRVELAYTVYRDHDVVCRSATVTNDGAEPIRLECAHSAALDLPAGDYELMHLTGSWCREFAENRMPIRNGRFVIDSARGTSSAAHSPFAVVMQQGTNEASGRVYATTLSYSGNFAISVETGEFGDVRLLTGINPFNFSWLLEPGESFQTPEAYLVFCDQGLDGMSGIWHAFIQEQIVPERPAGRPAPTYLNTWEACYFEVDEERVESLADRAVALGTELLVLDDGWFEGRADDTTSLGDWTPDPSKFPQGIEAIGRAVARRGVRFGLWLEPEMVNPKSKLYTAHPDWIIGSADRKPSLARHQLVLDLSREDVIDYLYEAISTLLATNVIDYVKWDFNRCLTEVASSAQPPERQQETSHRYILGLYDLIGRLTSEYPNVLFENCASGGNRVDLGMLSFFHQSYLSDMSEAFGRLDILNGASYLFPPSVLTAYIGPTPSHQNGRVSSLTAAAHSAFFCGCRGLSLNETDIEANADELKRIVAEFKSSAEDAIHGRFRRLMHTANETCWQLSAADESVVYVGYFRALAKPNTPFRRVRLRGLNNASRYQLEGTDSVHTGAVLTGAGLDLPVSDAMLPLPGVEYLAMGDFASSLLVLRRVDDAA